MESTVKDVIDCFDMEGLQNISVNHYLVLTTLTLCKALIVCNRNLRINFTIFQTLECGFQLFTKYDIRLPKPVLYLQILHGLSVVEFSGYKPFPVADIPDFLKEQLPAFKDFNLRTFSLPNIVGDPLKDENYRQCVRTWVDTLKLIDNGLLMPPRVEYMEKVVLAVNEN
jgi:hypothetical protein